MEKEIFFSIEESEEGCFVAESSEYSLRTESESLEGVVREIHYAILSEFEEVDRPTRINLEFPDESGEI